MQQRVNEKLVVDWKTKFMEKLFPMNRSDMDMEFAYLLKYRNLPEHIYKYRVVNEYSLQNLREGKVWLADPQTLNDPYECAHSIDFELVQQEGLRSPPPGLFDQCVNGKIDPKIMEAIKSSNDPTRALMDELFANEPPDRKEELMSALYEVVGKLNEDLSYAAISRMKSAFKLCSFSERVDSTLMWAHYANYHQGFCIEYNMKSVPYTDYVSRFMYPVIYSEKLIDLTQHVLRGIEHPEFNVIYANQIGLTKSIDWAYEQEWRLLFGNGLIKEAQSYPMPKPTMVYLGSHISQTDQEALVRLCQEIDVPFKKMQHSTMEYKMVALPVVEVDRTRFGAS